MKRWVLRICAFMLLGAIVNVATTPLLWLQRFKPDGLYLEPSVDNNLHWAGSRSEDFLPSPLFAREWRARGLHVTMLCSDRLGNSTFERNERSSTVQTSGGRAAWDTITIARSGLPFPALETIYVRANHPAAPLASPSISIPSNRIRPIWPGFAINTVFYAAILWGLFAAPFALRRWRRIKRGLCPKCAYDLRASESPACPECGATIRPASAPDTMPARTSAPSA